MISAVIGKTADGSIKRMEALSAQPHQSAVVLGHVKAEPDGGREERPALTCPVRAGCIDLWLGRKKACGAVEQKK